MLEDGVARRLYTAELPNPIGPHLNDIPSPRVDVPSPRVPSAAEMPTLLELAHKQLTDANLWINPDYGLKSRKWWEHRPWRQRE